MSEFASLGGEAVVLSAHGKDAVSIAVTHPVFGRVSTVRLDTETAAELTGALTGLLLDRHGVPEEGPDHA
jgi:hypothetical protein